MPKLCECARSVAASRQYNQFEINFTHARQWWITWMCAMRAVWLRKHKFIITYVVRVAYVCVCNIIDDCLLPQQRLVEQFPFLICCWRFPSGYSHHYQLIDEIIECVSLALLLHQHITFEIFGNIISSFQRALFFGYCGRPPRGICILQFTHLAYVKVCVVCITHGSKYRAGGGRKRGDAAILCNEN